MQPSDLNLPGSFVYFRPDQLEVAIEIAGSIKRVSKLDAPTGAGKSLIVNTVSKILGVRTLILTARKGLQDQYANDFEVADLRGASNYPCPYHTTCEIPSKIEVVCPAVMRRECPRQLAIQTARESQVVVTNYHCWLAFNRYGERFDAKTGERNGNKNPLGDFGLMVCDEGHSAPKILSDFCTIMINRKEAAALLSVESKSIPPTSASVEVWAAWAGSVLEIARAKYTKIKKGEVKRKTALVELGKGLADLAKTHEGRDYGYWIAEEVEGGDSNKIQFTPSPWPSKHAENLLFRSTPKIILSSAFLPPSIGARLGLRSKDIDRFEIDSSFDPKRRPFYYIPRVKVRKEMTDGEFQALVMAFDEVVGGRPDRKGIIHCRSYDWGKKVYRYSRHKSRLMLHTSETTTTTIERFKESNDPLVLVSPAVEEGYDFAGDLARFQIILRVPLIYSKDPLTKARSQFDPKYIYEEAAQSLVQQVGRSTRSQEDASEIYIFDITWEWFKRATKFPKFFRKSWRRVSHIPPAMKVEQLRSTKVADQE